MKLTQKHIDFLNAQDGRVEMLALSDFQNKFNLTNQETCELYHKWDKQKG